MNDASNTSDSRTVSPGGATTTPTSSALGQLVDGRYRIAAPLAAGGMGSVYLAEQDNLRRRVAIKRVSQPDADSAERFRREAEALAAVSHPAIVEVFDYVNDPDAGVCYLVMAYVAGENVADYVATRPTGVIGPLESVELLLPVASALVELHAHEILHRDIKPANLVRYVRADGRPAVKLVDFGIARRAQDPGLTAEGLIVGTPPYLSPEVILGKGHSEASDVYAFGATLFELLTGAPPHGREDLHQILKRATQGQVELPPELEYSPLGGLLMSTLAKDDASRPTMMAVLEQLERIQLRLLQESGAHDAALVATRAATPSVMTGIAPPAGGPPAPREAATVELSQPQGAPAAAALRSDRATALVAGPAPDRTTDAVKVTPVALPQPRASAVPWIVAGVAVALAVAVTLFFSLRGPSKKAQGPADTNAAQVAPSDAVMQGAPPPAARRARRSGMATRPAPVDGPSFKNVIPDELRRQLALCRSDVNAAVKMLFGAKLDFKRRRRRAHAKTTFLALLRCGKNAGSGRRAWAAYYLAHLHAQDGECAAVDRRWTQYVALAGKSRNRALIKPRCPPTRR